MLKIILMKGSLTNDDNNALDDIHDSNGGGIGANKVRDNDALSNVCGNDLGNRQVERVLH